MKKITLLALLLVQNLVLLAQKPQLVPPMGHSYIVSEVAISPDGKYVLTAGGYPDNTVLLWTEGGQLLKILDGHQNNVSDAEFSADGKYIFTLESKTRTLNLWDNQGKKLRKLPDLDILAVCFSTDSQHVLGGDFDGNIKRFDLNGKLVQTIKASDREINKVICSKDGRYLAAGDYGGIIRIFNQAGELLNTLDGHGQYAINALAFSPDGQKILSGGYNYKVRLWDWRNNKVIKEIDQHRTVISTVAFSPDGAYLATAGSSENDVFLWDKQGNLLQKFQEDRINDLDFTPDGKALLMAPWSKSAKSYDLNGQHINSYSNDASPVTSVGFSPFAPDSIFIVTGGNGTHIRLWDAVSGEVQGFLNQKDFNTPVAFNPQYPSVMLAESGDSLYHYDLYSDEHIAIEKSAQVSHSSLVYNFAGDHFLISNFSGGIQLWREGDQEWEEIWENQLDSNQVTSLNFSPDGQYFLTATNRHWVPEVLKIIPEKRDQPYNQQGFPAVLRRVDDFTTVQQYGSSADKAVFSPDGKYVATNETYGLSVYNRQTARELFHISDAGNGVFEIATCLAFSPNSQSVVVGFTSNVIRQYNLQGKLIRQYEGHLSAIRAVSFSPSGQFLISGSNDNTAKIWNTQTAAEMATLMAVGKEDWLVTTPEGLFDASEGAMEHLYYVAGIEVIALDQLKDRYYEPGLLAKVMGFAEGPIRKVSDLDNQELALYPDLVEAKLLDDQISVQLTKRSGGIGPVSLILDDDIEIATDVNPERKANFTINLQQYAKHFIPGEINKLSLVFFNADKWLPSPPHHINYVPGSKGKDTPNLISLNDRSDQAISNTLYALVVGTSDYKGTQLDLKFPDLDAAAYKDMLQISAAGLFGNRMQIKLLSTAKGNTRPSKTAIRAALMEFAAKAEPKDVLIVYFSGHGATWPENDPSSQFYFLSIDNENFDLANPVNRQLALAQDSLQAWIRSVKARKRILILDACNSGEVVKQLDLGAKGSTLNTDQRRALERMKDRGGFFVLAGSAADMKSYEDPRFGHGLLTYSLLNNMPKVAAGDKNNYIDVGKLFQEVRDDVPKLAAALNKIQEPKLIGMEDFSIGIIKNDTKYKLPTAKKIIISSDFSNKKRLDPLKFKAEFNSQLEAMLANPELPFAYYPTDKAQGLHYFINGEYEVIATTAKVTAYLYKSDQENELETFNVEGSSTNVKALVEQVLVKVKEALAKLK
ncbi:eIF2A-related protein [Haliscomenobacter hydrossis]|uniref:Peptidase C14 caspase catalytic subunit p20 n=1 Tax=Haliscomenobacter hydrossis (strain ATCC 27775 / DSM 1100 / LMG 10767 / O) TaxID=760192 RepID=F4KPI3_HALH1|nr:caspase family protein [Haliscomenobacter hydrossis]AEE49937.1 peptidase C14 caspase catalytic subunit p20 [Haliscomenobacter hydrossis DSM 1100]